jgi:hypothetical protein
MVLYSRDLLIENQVTIIEKMKFDFLYVNEFVI